MPTRTATTANRPMAAAGTSASRTLTAQRCVSMLLMLMLLPIVQHTNAAANGAEDNTSARVLAQQTGATQFEEERLDVHKDCKGGEHKHHLQKRASDEDIDYEVYQGVVGRPGIDFPIYPRIPKTTFSCRSFGNGYFADMETDCQVFHICEEGRKISFLCPNGTIFQQSELTCDWWFKVNCLGSPGYYAESSEILNKQRLQRLRPAVPVQGFNIVGGGLNIKPKISNVPAIQSRSRLNSHNGKNDRRVDSIEQHSLETVDFDDLSAEKQLKGQQNKVISNIDDNSNNANGDNDETQLTAESASFVGANRRSGYTYEKNNGDVQRKAGEGRNAVRNDLGTSRRGGLNGGNGKNGNDKNGNGDGNESHKNVNGAHKNGNSIANGNSNGNRSSNGNNINYGSGNGNNDNNGHGSINGNGNGGGAQKGSYVFGQGKPFTTESSAEKARPPTGRGQQRYRNDEKKQASEVTSRNGGSSSSGTVNGRDTKKYEKLVDSAGSFEGSTRTNGFTGTTETLAPQRGIDKSQQFTTSAGTYSTARRLDGTRTTPFYTPTVPSISKVKTTESKTYYVKTTKNNVNVGGVATTPNPNRISTGTGSSLFLETSVGTTPNLQSTETTRATLRPFIIGMRHDYGDLTSTEIYRIATNNNANVEQSLKNNVNTNINNNVVPDAATTLAATTTPRTPSTGPTYLPKNAAKPTTGFDAAGDDFLFAPIPTVGDPVARNVDDMLKTMNLLKDELNDVEVIKYQGGTREGLDIPPSSGPEVLVSLAKYFAGEETSKKNSINDVGKQELQKMPKLSVPSTTRVPLTQKEQAVVATLVAGKPSDTTASITIPSSSGEVQVKTDDIHAGLLREKTLSQYSNLFGLKDPKAKQGPVDPSEGLLSYVTESAITSTKSTAGVFPQIGSTDATIRQLAEKPDSRKIAQVFSNALTTYLEDPKSFREQLVSVRPTEPPPTNRPNFTPVTATDSTLFNGGTGATYLPTKPTPPTRSRPVITTERSGIAAEINSKLETSTADVSLETTTFSTIRDGKSALELSGELSPPGFDSGEGDEFLQREQTQSFVKSRNDLAADKLDNAKKAQQKTTTTAQTTLKTTENPWVHISQTDFLDPLTINDGLMRETTTTPSPFTYLPKKTTTALPITTTSINTPTTTSIPTRTPTTKITQSSQRLQQNNNAFVGSAEVTTSRSVSFYRNLEAGSGVGSGYGGESGGIIGTRGRNNLNGNSWQDIFDTYDIPRESLPSSSGLQRIANKLFGGLNETEALHLKNVMLQAEHNRQVLGLLLLLIQTCDDQNGKALERSRKHLLNALIDMDGKLASETGGKTSYDKALATTTTTTRVPVTTYRRNTDEYLANTTPFAPTELPLSVTTTFANFGASVEETTKFEIRVADVDDDDVALSTPSPSSASSRGGAKQPAAGANSSDKRALELLKSLYSLASKFSSRR